MRYFNPFKSTEQASASGILKFISALISFILVFSSVKTVCLAQTAIDVDIGVVLPQDSVIYTSLVEHAEDEINDYMAQNGIPYRFYFPMDSAQGQAAVYLEKVQGFKSMDVNLIIGGAWSSQAQASLGYVNDNDMLLVSWSSTSPLLNIDDNLYRLTPNDLDQTLALSHMLLSWGIETVVVIQRADSWADGIYNYFSSRYQEESGIVLDRMRYPGETTDFSSYLASMEDTMTDALDMYSDENVGVLVLGFSEVANLLVQAQEYPQIFNLKWFGADASARNAAILDVADFEAPKVGLLSPFLAVPYNDEYFGLYEWYSSQAAGIPGFYDAALYDACWVVALSVVEAGSSDAMQVKNVLSSVAAEYDGASGRVILDGNGDRVQVSRDIWRYVIEDYETCGFFEGETGWVYWDTDACNPPNSPPIVEANGPYTGEARSSIRFSSDGTNDTDGWLQSYLWVFRDDATSSQSNPFHSYFEAGDYTVTLKAADNMYSASMDQATAFVEAPPALPDYIALTAGSFSLYSQESTLLRARVLDTEGEPVSGLAVAFSLEGQGGAISDTLETTDYDGYTSVTVSAHRPGSFTVIARVDEYELEAATKFTVLNSAPSVTITGVSPRFPEEEEIVTFNAEATDPDDEQLTVEWNSDVQGYLGNGRTVRYRDLRYGNHIVTVTAEDPSGATAQDTYYLSVRDASRPIITETWLTPAKPTSEEPFRVSAAVTDTGSGVDMVKVSCCINNEDASEVEMRLIDENNNIWALEMSGLDGGSDISFVFNAFDVAGNLGTAGPIALTIPRTFIERLPDLIVPAAGGAAAGGGVISGGRRIRRSRERSRKKEDEELDDEGSGYNWEMIPPLFMNAGGKSKVIHVLRNKGKGTLSGLSVSLTSTADIEAESYSFGLTPFTAKIIYTRITAAEEAEGLQLLEFTLNRGEKVIETKRTIVQIRDLQVGVLLPNEYGEKVGGLLSEAELSYVHHGPANQFSEYDVVLTSTKYPDLEAVRGEITDLVEKGKGLVLLDSIGDSYIATPTVNELRQLLGYEADGLVEFRQGKGLTVVNEKHPITRGYKKGYKTGLQRHAGKSFKGNHPGTLLEQSVNVEGGTITLPGIVYREISGRLVHFNFNTEGCLADVAEYVTDSVRWAGRFT
jgi:branched-chain amino acid transport system substrate-binding protein